MRTLGSEGTWQELHSKRSGRLRPSLLPRGPRRKAVTFSRGNGRMTRALGSGSRTSGLASHSLPLIITPPRQAFFLDHLVCNRGIHCKALTERKTDLEMCPEAWYSALAPTAPSESRTATGLTGTRAVKGSVPPPRAPGPSPGGSQVQVSRSPTRPGVTL